MNSKKLFVGGLPYSVSDGQLAELFAQHGTVESAHVVINHMTGRSKGFGFVEMGTEAEAQSALESLDGTEYGGRTLTVNEARPRPPRSNWSGGRSRV